MDISYDSASLLALTKDSLHLSSEVSNILQHGSSSQYLDAVSKLALEPQWTSAVFTTHRSLFVDICSRWISRKDFEARVVDVASALAKILPCAPHLSEYAELLVCQRQAGAIGALSSPDIDQLNDIPEKILQVLLLTLVRLLIFDNGTFASAISPAKMQLLLVHSNLSVRYLAIKIIALYLHASDETMAEMVKIYIGDIEVFGGYENQTIDFTFFGLWEEKRISELQNMSRHHQQARETTSMRTSAQRIVDPTDLSDLTASFAGTLVPRIDGKPEKLSNLVMNDSTLQNLKLVAEAINKSSPILITGRSGSGKTLMINSIAQDLAKDSKLLTLHLNEQTDAKLLIGMYKSVKTPGEFTWQPGVLTTAVLQGRWILIEDLDRAPAEVVSTLLPLLERGELLVPNLGDPVRASPGFKLIATIRSVLNIQGKEILPGPAILGARYWNQVSLCMPSETDLGMVISREFNLLKGYSSDIMTLYSELSSDASTVRQYGKKLSTGRPHGPRDLMKLCKRLNMLLMVSGAQCGDEPFTEGFQDDMFLEAVDCFAAGSQSKELKDEIIASIAHTLRIPTARSDYCMSVRIPACSSVPNGLSIGRVTLGRHSSTLAGSRAAQKNAKRPFAMTPHAVRLCESIAVAVKMQEPCLLVGETGTGKTASIQELAERLGHHLVVVNLSQQSEAGDLLGGYKPLSTRSLALPMKEEFERLFEMTFSQKRNHRYVEQLGRTIAKGNWSRTLILWQEALRMVRDTFQSVSQDHHDGDALRNAKRRKLESPRHQKLMSRWGLFASQVQVFEVHLQKGDKGVAFSFVEGNIVKAARNGDWVLLDEINLASPDTLEGIADLLSGGAGSVPSVLLPETGSLDRIYAHESFRIFGAMNPATDVGKRDLPIGLRSRFTEYFVEEPDKDLGSLIKVVEAYLGAHTHTDVRAASDVAKLYLEIKKLIRENCLVDGANHKPHVSLRSLTRTLVFATDTAPVYGLRRSLYEGFSMSFLTLLNKESESRALPLISDYILGSRSNRRALLKQVTRPPDTTRKYTRFMQYWVAQGPLPIAERSRYIITPFVERNLLNLVRATSTRRFPVLLQGPTSSGKTSMIEHLAQISGNKFVRINNHEHTDLQEYLGTYVSDSAGQLSFREGILVNALREGAWIVLDELNLAPTDVLEALNRLLDDNRELLIPETQEIVRPHENFMLFATQNPPGLYGGRKVLSRAFRNRFLELHFDDIPEDELETILRERSQIAPSFCSKIVAVYKRLSLLRQTSRIFEQGNSFATLRDLFRWAFRDADDREQLAINGYMLLAERVRNPEERAVVKAVIEEIMKVEIKESNIYSAEHVESLRGPDTDMLASKIVWTKSMRRLFILISESLKNNEPVLLVGETGSGKTSVCQVIAEVMGRQLKIVNAHQNTETGDLIGAHRPLRNRAAIQKQLVQDISKVLQSVRPMNQLNSSLTSMLEMYDCLLVEGFPQGTPDVLERIAIARGELASIFEWSDGSLVQAMKTGHHFLLDEISLADDSVLERLNSVLEPARELLLAEKGPTDALVHAENGFQFLATMNPGGDYGKKELSPALRNRFTEIWVPPVSDSQDILEIATAKLSPSMSHFASPLVDFACWFGTEHAKSPSISIREVLAWIQILNIHNHLNPYHSILHGAAMVYIDGIGANPAATLHVAENLIGAKRETCLERLSEFFRHDMIALYNEEIIITNQERYLSIGHFRLRKHHVAISPVPFSLQAPTTKANAMRIIRALQVQKPILLEGSPGVGKTSLVTALAQAVGMPLTRINLSEQTDIMDLFGSDVPIENEGVASFTWRDAPFLRAMQRGEWVLLDEMNLASQSVLEGLNACLDHRGEVFVPGLDQSFSRHPGFAVFAAQNPHHHGGGRKGLPASFVNRFTLVYADILGPTDLLLIGQRLYPHVSAGIIQEMIHYVSNLQRYLQLNKGVASYGGPWEFNLRDILRWLELLTSPKSLIPAVSASDFCDVLFFQRLRLSTPDVAPIRDRMPRALTNDRFSGVFENLSTGSYQVGLAVLDRKQDLQRSLSRQQVIHQATKFPKLQSIMFCIQHNWPCLLVGSTGSGKTSAIHHLAVTLGADLVTMPLNADMDTMDLIGRYEQASLERNEAKLRGNVRRLLRRLLLSQLTATGHRDFIKILSQMISNIENVDLQSMQSELSSLFTSTGLSDFSVLAQEGQTLLKRLALDHRAQFEWVDGILIEALENGQWLVLDNANLCSSSVLDRLTALLEPDGHLSVTEQRCADGTARLVKPHPKFRLFLTMDPVHGELSQAMRNRCIELYMPVEIKKVETKSRRSAYEFSMFRYQTFQLFDWALFHNAVSHDLVSLCLDHLAFRDLRLLRRWLQQAKQGLVILPESVAKSILPVFESFQKLMSSRGSIFDTIWKYYTHLDMKFPIDFLEAQTIHPLNNIALSSTPNSIDGVVDPIWLAGMLDVTNTLNCLAYEFESLQRNVSAKQGFQMSRLELSIALERHVKHAKSSTDNLAAFFKVTISFMQAWLMDKAFHFTSRFNVLKVLKEIVTYLFDFFDYVNGHKFEDAVFLTYLNLGRSHLQPNFQIDAVLEITKYLETQLSQVNKSCELSTGISMERLWHAFRGPTVRNHYQLQNALQIEELADRYDELKWKTNASLPDLVDLRQSLLSVYSSVGSSNTMSVGSFEDVTNALHDLEGALTGSSFPMEPHFQSVFASIIQYEFCSSTSSQQPVTSVLYLYAGLSTKSTMQISTASRGHELLRDIPFVTGRKGGTIELITVKQTIPILLLNKLQSMSTVPLKSLDLLVEETKALPIHVTSLANVSSPYCGYALNASLAALHREIYHAHEEYFLPHSLIDCQGFLRQILTDPFGLPNRLTASIPAIREDSTAPAQLQRVMNDYFLPSLRSMEAIRDRLMASNDDISALVGSSWIQFFTGCLLLYVPDRSFDPALRQAIARDRYSKRLSEMSSKISALELFEQNINDQNTSFRCEMAKKELQQLGGQPEAPTVVRPDVSQLEQLQGELNNLLNAVVHRSPNTDVISSILQGNSASVRGAELLRMNVDQSISRLSNRFRAYDDITKVIIGFLQGLDIGLALVLLSQSSRAGQGAVEYISQITPFLAEIPDAILDWNFEYIQGLKQSNWDPRFVYLEVAAFYRCLDGEINQKIVKNAVQIFHSFYEEWKDKLSKDQEEHGAMSSLYHYRGAQEEIETFDEEEILELFPSHTEASKPGHDDTHEQWIKNPRELAQVLATSHSQFLGANGDASHLMLNRLKVSCGEIANLTSNASCCMLSPSRLLSGTLLVMDDKFVELHQSDKSRKNYNFYRDSNLEEAQKVVQLVQQIRIKVKAIQKIWPEHASLGEILNRAAELLEFGHTETLSKMIMKSEQLHGCLHEWQAVASREFSIHDLYNELTALLISWRRLELASWAQLLDEELLKCHEDSKLWWFIAYEVIVAAPLQIAGSNEELSRYAVQLLQTLSEFLYNTPLGQYTQRLHLTRQFLDYLIVLESEMPNLKILRSALENFVRYYRRYEPTIKEVLDRGRQVLEKDLREIVLLASWKDTNIHALRDSAKRSHVKLFKIVRKYRNQLAINAEAVLRQGIRSESLAVVHPSLIHTKSAQAVDQTAVDLCRDSLVNWENRPARYIRPTLTMSNMTHLSRLPEGVVDCSLYLDSFCTNLADTIGVLRKETPSTVTTENKELVKHLKSRKRRVYADTLKEIRQMGFKTNLSSDVLTKQASLSVVLADTPVFNLNALGEDASAAEYLFYKCLDDMPAIRASLSEHSEDITTSETSRSVGYLEGILVVILQQRSSLASSGTETTVLNQLVEKLRNLWAPRSYGVYRSFSGANNIGLSLHHILSRLPSIIKASKVVVETYNRLADSNMSEVVDGLENWLERIENSLGSLHSVPKLPDGLSTNIHATVHARERELLSQFTNDIQRWAKEYPKLGFIVAQLEMWTQLTNVPESLVQNQKLELDVSDLEGPIWSIVDKILICVQLLRDSISSLPISNHDSAWLLKGNTSMSKALKALHGNDIVRLLSDLMDRIHLFVSEDSTGDSVAAALCAVVLPIVEQYTAIRSEAVNRYVALHRSTCRLAQVLTSSFKEISKNGFCSPDEKSATEDSQTEKLESGTGLGEGQGVDDFSKDIQDDEDLTELAQEGNKEKDSDQLEDQEDAIDMQEAELEGKMGDTSDKEEDQDGDSGSDGMEKDFDEHIGDIDDLDPSAVDEKLWDEPPGDRQKEKEGRRGKQGKAEDENSAAQEGMDNEQTHSENSSEGRTDEQPAEEGDEIVHEELEKMDPHVPEEQKIELPEEVRLDGDKESVSDSNSSLEGMSDLFDVDEEQQTEAVDNASLDSHEDNDADLAQDDNLDTPDEADEKDDLGNAEEVGSPVDTEPEDTMEDFDVGLPNTQTDNAAGDPDDVVSSDMQGLGQHVDGNDNDQGQPESTTQGDTGTSSAPDKNITSQASAAEGEFADVMDHSEAAPGGPDRTQNEQQPFKKLGNALEKWHRQQMEIHDEPETESTNNRDQPYEAGDDQAFQHLPNEDTEGDTQALDAATEDQAQALDRRCLDAQMDDHPDGFMQDEDLKVKDDKMEDQLEISTNHLSSEQERAEKQVRPGAMVGSKDLQARLPQQSDFALPKTEEDLQELDSELSTIRIESTFENAPRSLAEARQLWSHYGNLTRNLSLSLTEQLRLILAPTLATKMRGDFRTGKRLNIKRIIPYIASQYKRDKIWMRRSVPSKRNYQIMLAVDDSKSMGESGSGDLAFETLALVSQSLSMLEVGEISVVGFGDDVHVAHPFERPFSGEAGIQVFQQFGFQQSRTDVRKLMSESIKLFREARSRARFSGADLWQLELIISDGVCEDHEGIRRLVRQAQEERIMTVFVIVDALRGESIMDMTQASFEPDEKGETKLRIKKYLEGFPFGYYLVVGNVKELPGVLATALRQWFSEVVENS